MAIVTQWDYRSLADFDDPDDYRPDSELAVVIDPAGSGKKPVEGLTVLYERIGPGDAIPVHQHSIEEVFFLDEGTLEVTLGGERQTVEPSALVFIPAGVAHGFRNVGETMARVHAVFPSAELTIRYVERNAAPGTEGDQPGPPVAYNVRELLEGDPEKAVRPLSEAQFRSALT